MGTFHAESGRTINYTRSDRVPTGMTGLEFGDLRNTTKYILWVNRVASDATPERHTLYVTLYVDNGDGSKTPILEDELVRDGDVVTFDGDTYRKFVYTVPQEVVEAALNAPRTWVPLVLVEDEAGSES